MAQLPTPGGDSGNWGTILNEYLEVEHNADGTHKTEYLPLAGGELSGNVDFNGNQATQPNLVNYSELAVIANSTSDYTINPSLGNVYALTLTANCTITFAGVPASGLSCSINLILIQDGSGSRTVTWPASVKWGAGSAPTLSTAIASTDIIQLFTVDGGTIWYGFLAGKGMA